MTRLVDLDRLSAADLAHLAALRQAREDAEGFERVGRRVLPEPVTRAAYEAAWARFFDSVDCDDATFDAAHEHLAALTDRAAVGGLIDLAVAA